MKKILLIFSSLLILSCKNVERNKLIDTTYNKEKQENKNSNIKISNNRLPEIKKNEEITGVYQDQDGFYHLRYILEVGKTYNFNSKEVQKQSILFREKEQKVSQESFDPTNFTVLSFQDGKYKLKVQIGGRKIITEADGMKSVFDTNGSQPKDPNQLRMWKMYRAISKASFTMNMDIYGSVSNIEGMENIYKKAEAALSNDLKGNELKEFIKAFKKSINPESFKLQFENSMINFPAKGLKVGEKWNNDPSQKKNGYNQLVKVTDTTAEVIIDGKIPSKSESKVIEGVTYKVSINGTQKGKVIIDKKSGWINKASLSLRVTEIKSAQKDNKSEKIVQKTENHTFIN